MAEPDHKRWENEQQEAIHEMKLKCGGREEKLKWNFARADVKLEVKSKRTLNNCFHRYPGWFCFVEDF
jgi:hypothetical protein